MHFYNKRNIAVNAAGQEVAFDLLQSVPRRATPRSGRRRRSSTTSRTSPASPPPRRPPRGYGVTARNGQVGNLGLTASQEADLVNFLKILSDGYTAPNPVGG